MYWGILPPGEKWEACNGFDKFAFVFMFLLKIAFYVLFLPVLYLAKKK